MKILAPFFVILATSVASAQDIVVDVKAGLADAAGPDAADPDPRSFAECRSIAEGEYLRVEFEIVAGVTADVTVFARSTSGAHVIRAFKDPVGSRSCTVLWKVAFTDTLKAGEVDIEVNATVRTPAARQGTRQTASTRVTLLPKKKWTVAIYANGDDKPLDPYIAAAVEAMATAGSTDDVNVIVLHDRVGMKSQQPPVGNTRLLRLEKPGTFTSYKQGYHLLGCLDFPERASADQPFAASAQWVIDRATSEADMSCVDTLRNFLLYAEKFHPAERMIVVLGDHGGGWCGTQSDDASPGRLVSLGDLNAAFQALATARGRKLDLLYFDCCLMAQVEVLALLHPNVAYAVASEPIAWGQTPYGPWLLHLQAHVGDATSVVAATLVKQFYPSTVTTAAAFRVTGDSPAEPDISTLVAALGDFTNQAVAAAANDNIDFILAREACASGDVNIDAAGHLRRVAACTADLKSWLDALSRRPVAARLPIAALSKLIDDVQLQTYVHADYRGKMHGLSVFYPTQLLKRNIEWMRYYYPDPKSAQLDAANVVIWDPTNAGVSRLASVTGSWSKAIDLAGAAPAGLKAWCGLLTHDFVPPRVRALKVVSKDAIVIDQDLGDYQLVEPSGAKADATAGPLTVTITFNEKMRTTEAADVSFGTEDPWRLAVLKPVGGANGWIDDHTWSGQIEIASVEAFRGLNRLRISARDATGNVTDLDFEKPEAKPDTRFTFSVWESENLCDTIKPPDGDYFAYKLTGSITLGERVEPCDELKIITPKDEPTMELQLLLGPDDTTLGLFAQGVMAWIPEGSNHPSFLAKESPLLTTGFGRKIPITNATITGESPDLEKVFNGTLTLLKCSEDEIAGHFSCFFQVDVWARSGGTRVQVAKGRVGIAGCFRFSKPRVKIASVSALRTAATIARAASFEMKAHEHELQDAAERWGKLRAASLDAARSLPSAEEFKRFAQKLDPNEFLRLRDELRELEKTGDEAGIRKLAESVQRKADPALQAAERVRTPEMEALKKELEEAGRRGDMKKLEELADKMKKIVEKAETDIAAVTEDYRQKVLLRLHAIRTPHVIRPH